MIFIPLLHTSNSSPVELTAALRKSNVRQASYLGARLASFDKNNDGNISIGELGKNYSLQESMHTNITMFVCSC